MSGSAADVVDDDPNSVLRRSLLARMESRIAFEEFFTRVPNYELVGLFTHREQRGIASLPGRLESGSR